MTKLPPIHLACVMDEFRYNMALIEIKNGVASATNGHMIVNIELAKHTDFSEDDLKKLE
jgi:hypothetical protein